MSEEKRLANFLPLVILALYLVNLSSGIEAVTGVPGRLISLLAKGILAVYIMINLPALFRRMDVAVIAIILITMIIATVNIMFFPETKTWFQDTLIDFTTICMPTMLFSYVLSDGDRMYNNLVLVSRGLLVVTIAMFGMLALQGHISAFNKGSYSMGFGYACVLPTIILLMNYLQNNRKTDLLGTIVMLLVVLAFGSRGPLLSIALFLMIFGIRYLIKMHKYMVLAGAVLLVLIGLIFYKEILSALISLLKTVGIESRTLTLLLEDIMHSSGRENMYLPLWKEILNHPLRVRGINAEWLIFGVYAHSLPLELLYQGGMILGGAALLVIMLCAGKTLLFAPLDSDGRMEIVFACVSLSQLTYSSSLWISYTFWVWIAFLIRRRLRT